MVTVRFAQSIRPLFEMNQYATLNTQLLQSNACGRNFGEMFPRFYSWRKFCRIGAARAARHRSTLSSLRRADLMMAINYQQNVTRKTTRTRAGGRSRAGERGRRRGRGTRRGKGGRGETEKGVCRPEWAPGVGRGREGRRAGRDASGAKKKARYSGYA